MSPQKWITGKLTILQSILARRALKSLFLATGVVGGFTTFSAFSQETLTLFREGNVGYALLYISASLILGLLATYMAYLLVKTN